jgi:catechol 2,3-dioxygenase-like lactoylglutathione lyase family enzyme
VGSCKADCNHEPVEQVEFFITARHVRGAMRSPMRLDQVGLRVSNLQRSLRFYTKALGLRITARGDTRSWGGGLWVQLEDPRSRRNVELNWYPRGSLFYERYNVGGGIDHLDFALGAVPRSVLESVHSRLLRSGARATRYTPATTEGWMASVLDPGGIWITIGRRPTAAEQKAMTNARAAKRRKRKPATRP